MGVYIMELTEKKEFDLLSLGEIMLRLSPPDNERITRGDSFSKQALRIMNYNLGRLARRCGVITKVSSYTTRHTWATLAKYCNFSEQLICEAFGHSSVKVTETYLKNFKYEEIKKANDAIILYVSKNGKKRA